jgi:NAD(P)-dependent dehydrogenase (short-subunit alcohol dehydrogenase family)
MTARPLYVVTGSGRGLGLAIAERLGRDGAAIVVAELRPEVAEKGVAHLEEHDIEVHRVDTDVADADSVAALVAAVEDLGGAHGLVNNAALADGVGGLPFHQIEEPQFSRILDVNVRGTWLVSKALYAQVAAHRGAIVNLASDAALYGSPRLAHYIASKGAIIAMTRGMARDAGPDGVRVNAVAPGLTRVEATGDFARCGWAARITLSAPKIFSSSSSRTWSSVVSSMVAINDRPALHTTASMPPSSATLDSTNASIDARSVTSPATVCTRPAPSVCSRASCSAATSRSASRAQAATWAPSASSIRAVARPTPELAPVTRTVRSRSPRSMSVLRLRGVGGWCWYGAHGITNPPSTTRVWPVM